MSVALTGVPDVPIRLLMAMGQVYLAFLNVTHLPRRNLLGTWRW